MEEYNKKLEEYKKVQYKFNGNERIIRKLNKSIESEERELVELKDSREKYYKKCAKDLKQESIERFDYLKDECDNKKKECDSYRSRTFTKNDIDVKEFKNAHDEYKILNGLSKSLVYLSESGIDMGKLDADTKISSKSLLIRLYKSVKDEIAVPIKKDCDFVTSKDDNRKFLNKYNSIRDKLDDSISKASELKENSNIKPIFILFYITGILAFILSMSFLFLTGIFSIKELKEERELLNKKNLAKKRLKNFEYHFNKLADEVKTMEKDYVAKELKKLEDERDSTYNSMLSEYNNLKCEYDSKVSNANYDEEVLNSLVDRRYSKQINEQESLIADEKEQLSNKKQEQENLKDEINKLLVELEKEKEELQNTYFNLSKIGKGKLMIDRFILGFRDLDIQYMNFHNKSINIMYDGETSESNSILINMMIAQLLCNIEPNCISFVIIDTDYSCRDYSVYARKGLYDTFKFVTDDVLSHIENAYDEMKNNQLFIGPIANSIDDYNKKMISNSSLTQPYTIIIIQDLNEKIIESDSFKQLVRSGPLYGILTISFFNKKLFNYLKEKQKEDKGKISMLEEYIQTCKDSTFTLSHKSMDLEPYNVVM